MPSPADREKALESALAQIDRQFGKGSVMRLGSDERAFVPLTDKETDWFLSFMDREHVVRMSEGYIDGDKVVVTRGPLMGFEGQIRRVDRHKRRAYLDVTMFGRTVPTSFGLVIGRKVA